MPQASSLFSLTPALLYWPALMDRGVVMGGQYQGREAGLGGLLVPAQCVLRW